MKILRRLALGFLIAVSVTSLVPEILTSSSYDTQHRRHPNEEPGAEFLLGTDDLGRDRFSRLLYGTRTSLALAPAASLLATAIATIGGAASAYFGRLRTPMFYLVDVIVSTPLLFLLLIIRSLLPLDTSSALSVSIMFALLGLLGWASGVRTFAAATQRLANSDFVVQAQASGCAPSRLVMMQLLPGLFPAIFAQFCVFIPVFVMAEANLSMLGLGVSEPLPSLGNLMSDLLNYPAVIEQPWLLAPAVLLFCIMASLQILMPKVS
jgi:peptide/nickel transport system permease protein